MEGLIAVISLLCGVAMGWLVNDKYHKLLLKVTEEPQDIRLKREEHERQVSNLFGYNEDIAIGGNKE